MTEIINALKEIIENARNIYLRDAAARMLGFYYRMDNSLLDYILNLPDEVIGGRSYSLCYILRNNNNIEINEKIKKGLADALYCIDDHETLYYAVELIKKYGIDVKDTVKDVLQVCDCDYAAARLKQLLK